MQSASHLSVSAGTKQAMSEGLAALSQALPGPADLGFVFATPHHSAGLGQVVEQMQATLGCKVVLAATVPGVIGGGRVVASGPGLVMQASCLPDAGLHVFSLDPAGNAAPGNTQPPLSDSHGHAGQADACGGNAACETVSQPTTSGAGPLSDDAALASICQSDEPPRAFVVLADAHSVAFDGLLKRMGQVWPGVPITGGRVLGGVQPGSTGLWVNGGMQSTGAVGVAITGQIAVRATQSHCVVLASEPVVVTQAKRMLVKGVRGRSVKAWLAASFATLTDAQRQQVLAGGWLVGRLLDERLDPQDPNHHAFHPLAKVDPGLGCLVVPDAGLHAGQTLGLFLPASGASGSNALPWHAYPRETHSEPQQGGMALVFADWQLTQGWDRSVADHGPGDAAVGALVHGQVVGAAGRSAVSSHGWTWMGWSADQADGMA